MTVKMTDTKMIDNNQTDLKKIYATATADKLPDRINIQLVKETDLRYGENPNQAGAIYRTEEPNNYANQLKIELLKSGKEGLSATNVMDVTRAADILKFFEKPSAAIMKHAIPSGFATQAAEGETEKKLVELYKDARDADARSAFGSVVVINTRVDLETANEIKKSYVEAVAATDFDEDALQELSSGKNMRILRVSNIQKILRFSDELEEKNEQGENFEIKTLPGGKILVQRPYLSRIKCSKELILQPMVQNKEGRLIKAERIPSEQEIQDLITSWYINIGVRSNGIVIVKKGVTLAIGSGQQERVGAVEQAIVKAYQKAMDREGIKYAPLNVMAFKDKLSTQPLKGAAVSSDAFFPFRDSVDLLAKHGVSAIIQPGGSVRDFEVIEAANEHKISMVFTTERCFGHF
jgi:phosphoribosylaminoimidazolecarboxamide formyltransferase/IMP cyclohydrolase